MMDYVNLSITDADILMYLTEFKEDEFEIDKDIEKIADLNSEKKPVLLLINKVDLIEKSKLLPLIEKYSTTGAKKFAKSMSVTSLCPEIRTV